MSGDDSNLVVNVVVTHKHRLKCFLNDLVFGRTKIPVSQSQDILNFFSGKTGDFLNGCIVRVVMPYTGNNNKTQVELVHSGYGAKPGKSYWTTKEYYDAEISKLSGPTDGLTEFDKVNEQKPNISSIPFPDIKLSTIFPNQGNVRYEFYLIRHGLAEHNVNKPNFKCDTRTISYLERTSPTQSGGDIIPKNIYSLFTSKSPSKVEAEDEAEDINRRAISYDSAPSMIVNGLYDTGAKLFDILLKKRNLYPDIKISNAFVSDLVRTRDTLSDVLTGFDMIEKPLQQSSMLRDISKHIYVLPCAHELNVTKGKTCDGNQAILPGVQNENKLCNGINDVPIDISGVKFEVDRSQYDFFYGGSIGRVNSNNNKGRQHCRDTNMIINAMEIIRNSTPRESLVQVFGGRRRHRKTKIMKGSVRHKKTKKQRSKTTLRRKNQKSRRH